MGSWVLDSYQVNLSNAIHVHAFMKTPVAAEAPTRKTVAGSGKIVRKMIVTSTNIEYSL